MKKVLVLILCISMMVGLTACNNSNDDKDSKDKVEDTKVSGETKEEETDETEEEKDTKEAETEETADTNTNSDVELAPYPYTKRTPRISIETPKDYMAINQGYTQMFNVGRDKSISLVTHKDYVPSSLEDAHDAAFEEYIQGFNNYARIDTLTAEKEEVIEINGREMYHFEGKINCIGNQKDYSLYCTGYSFIFDDIPVMLIGTVLEKEQPQEMIDEVKMYTDAMIQTVRHRDEE